MLGYLGLTVWRNRKASRWPAVEGTIEEARTEDLKDRSNLGGYTTALVISYSYQVDGNFYGGYQQFNYRPGAPYSFLVGRKVPVRYKPDRPATSRLLSLPKDTGSTGQAGGAVSG